MVAYKPQEETKMTEQAGTLLVEQIAPRLRTLVPKSVRPVGAEDEQELLQDAITIAAQMLHRVEESGKKFTAGTIAFYTVLHMKSGRRSQGSSRVDTMATGTQLDGSSSVLSFEEEVGYDPELDEPITLEQLLASEHQDPAMTAGRNVDWEVFIVSVRRRSTSGQGRRCQRMDAYDIYDWQFRSFQTGRLGPCASATAAPRGVA